MSNKLARGTKTSIRIDECQICHSSDLGEIISLGHIPQVNVMQSIGDRLQEETFFPAELLHCNNCSLVQISHIVDGEVVFPPDYTYTSRTTKILRENFALLAKEVEEKISLAMSELVVDIGSNDGTLLSNFNNTCRVLGVEPTNAAKYANEHNLPTIQKFFNKKTAQDIVKEYGKANIITCTNCFAHIEDVHSILDGIKELLTDDGIFISENHYLVGLLNTNQWDTIYHEHLRYYSLTSLQYLFNMHDMEIFDVSELPTHGGSIRVWSAVKGAKEISKNVQKMLDNEKSELTKEKFLEFKTNVIKSKTSLYSLLDNIEGTIGAIGSPSRAATLVNYIGLNEDIIKFILEAPGSNKIGKYMPGSKIPILEETPELLNSVDNLLLLSWHIADEMIPKLRAKGFKGKFISPLPQLHIIE